MVSRDKADVTVVGAGLAGCEAAWQAARLGARVALIDMKPERRSPAHNADTFAELVCSNSLGARSVDTAKGLLQHELRVLGSLIMAKADACAVPAGGALAADREAFSNAVTAAIEDNPLIETVCERVTSIPTDGIRVIATGPLTDGELAGDIASLTGSSGLYFFDASAPIIAFDSIDASRTFRASRYGKSMETETAAEGGADTAEGDYVNCPMDKERYEAFVDALLCAKTADPKGFEPDRLFEGCMPVESMAARGRDALRFGPLKPKGLVDPATGREPYAVVQLRRDNASGDMYNMVGFQTRLRRGEQKRVFGMIPGLMGAEYLRYGAMHRNSYIDSPRTLDARYSAGGGLYFAGQLTGVEGYLESVSSGLIAGLNAALEFFGRPASILPPESMAGAISRYASGGAGIRGAFSPMNANFGLLPPDPDAPRGKRARRQALAERALRRLAETRLAESSRPD